MKLLYERMIGLKLSGRKIRCWIPEDSKVMYEDIRHEFFNILEKTLSTPSTEEIAQGLVEGLKLNACEVLHNDTDGSVVYADWP